MTDLKTNKCNLPKDKTICAVHAAANLQKKIVSKYFKVCASSGTGVFAFFAFIVLNLNVMVDVMFSAMIDIMINGVVAGAGNILLVME